MFSPTLQKQLEKKLAQAREFLANAVINEHYYANERVYLEAHIKLLESMLKDEKIIPSLYPNVPKPSSWEQFRVKAPKLPSNESLSSAA